MVTTLFIGFRKLEMDRQIMIVQMAMYPIVLTKLSTTYDIVNRKYNYFNFEEVSLIIKAFKLIKFPLFN